MISRREFLKGVAALTGGVLVMPVVDLEAKLDEVLPVSEEIPATKQAPLVTDRHRLSSHGSWVEINGEYIPALNLSVSISIPTHSYLNDDGFLINERVGRSWDACVTIADDCLASLFDKVGELVPVTFIVDYVKIAEGECYITSVEQGGISNLNQFMLSGNGSLKSMYEELCHA